MGQAVLGTQWSWEVSSHGPGGRDAHEYAGSWS